MRSLRGLLSTTSKHIFCSLQVVKSRPAASFFHYRSTDFPSTDGEVMSKWTAPPPACVGDDVSLVDTPALLVTMDQLQYNISQLVKYMAPFPSVVFRPHFKAHKCPSLAKLQMESGAVGLCTQTLVETEALVYENGCKNVLLSNQLIGKRKLNRLAAVAKQAEVAICVDDPGNIDDLSEVAQEAGVHLNCVVEVNVGQDRCGVAPGRPAVDLAKKIMALPGLSFQGIQAYNGWNQHVRKEEDRKAAVEKVVDLVKITLKVFDEEGVRCEQVTGGGTGTYLYEAASGVFTEVQPGSYVIMDADYSRNLDQSGGYVQDFQQSLYILTTVQSVTPGERFVVDAGMKAVSLDSGVPLIKDHPDLEYHLGGDEHGIIQPRDASKSQLINQFKVGDMLWLIPGHCDPTVNLHDYMIGIRDDTVETVWPISARNPGV